MAEHFALVFTVFFLLLGPVKIIPTFIQLTQGTDTRFKRELAAKGALIATAIVAFTALAGETFVPNFRISLPALRIAGGLVLLIAALIIMFSRARPAAPPAVRPTALQLAISPLATPAIVPPAGIAAILILLMLAPAYPGMGLAVAIGLVGILALDFLVMFFIDTVTKVPGLSLVLQILGAVLVFMQVALAVETMLRGVNGLGTVKG